MPKFFVTVTQIGTKVYEADSPEELDEILFEEEFEDFDFTRTEWEHYQLEEGSDA